MEATDESILLLVEAINNFALVADTAFSFDLFLFNTILLANILVYITGHATGRVISKLGK